MTGVEALERLEGVQEVLMAQAGELKRVLTQTSKGQRELLLLMVGVVPRQIAWKAGLVGLDGDWGNTRMVPVGICLLGTGKIPARDHRKPSCSPRPFPEPNQPASRL